MDQQSNSYTPDNQSLIQYALEFKRLKIGSIPTDQNKRPVVREWKSAQSRLSSKEELEVMFATPAARNLAIICGQVSGGLEVIDIDLKYDLTGTLGKEYFELINNADPTILPRCVIVKTPSAGYHIIYRCSIVGGNQKLAQRYTTEQEQIAAGLQGKKGTRVLIETRGEGGYVLTVPSAGYSIVRGSFRQMEPITPEERAIMISAAISFNKTSDKAEVDYGIQESKKVRSIEATGTPNYEWDGPSPIDDFNARADYMSMLMEDGWIIAEEANNAGNQYWKLTRPGKSEGISATFNYIPNKLYVFSTSTEFNAEEAISAFDYFSQTRYNGSMQLAIKAVMALGYGSTKKKREQPSEPSKAIRRVKRVDERLLPDDDFYMLNTFWSYVPPKKKDQDWRVVWDYSKYIAWLNSMGVWIYPKTMDEDMPFILINNNIVEEINVKYIKDMTMKYVRSLPNEFDGMYRIQLENHILSMAGKYFSDGYLEFLPKYDGLFLRDTKDESFIPYSNGVLRITASDISIIRYDDITVPVWKSHILPHDIKYDQDGATQSDFARFINRISNDKQERYDSVISYIGYLMHAYKDPSKPYAVVVCDEMDTEDPEGGTGKGLLMQSVAYVRRVVTLDGKKKDAMDKQFALQRIRPDTNVFAIQDVKKNFNFETIFNMVTEGFTVEKKFLGEVFIPYADSPKILINTNYSIQGEGSSHRRRKLTIEMFPYFSDFYTPVDEFGGRRFFDEWDWDEWNRFHSFAAMCINAYLQFGLLKTETINAKKRAFKDATSVDFVEWWTLSFGGGDRKEPQKAFGVHQKNRLYEEFLDYARITTKDLPHRYFYKWVNAGVKYSGLVCWSVDDNDGNPYGRKTAAWVITKPSDTKEYNGKTASAIMYSEGKGRKAENAKISNFGESAGLTYTLPSSDLSSENDIGIDFDAIEKPEYMPDDEE